MLVPRRAAVATQLLPCACHAPVETRSLPRDIAPFVLHAGTRPESPAPLETAPVVAPSIRTALFCGWRLRLLNLPPSLDVASTRPSRDALPEKVPGVQDSGVNHAA
jgi:hypothetical protein